MLIVLAAEHKQHLQFLNAVAPEGASRSGARAALTSAAVVSEFTRLAVDFLTKGAKAKLYAAASTKIIIISFNCIMVASPLSCREAAGADRRRPARRRGHHVPAHRVLQNHGACVCKFSLAISIMNTSIDLPVPAPSLCRCPRWTSTTRF